MILLNALFVLYGIGAVLAIVGLIVLSFRGETGPCDVPKQPEVKVDVHVKQDPPQTVYPTIAEQFDGRLTNIVRNPLEGIL